MPARKNIQAKNPERPAYLVLAALAVLVVAGGLLFSNASPTGFQVGFNQCSSAPPTPIIDSITEASQKVTLNLTLGSPAQGQCSASQVKIYKAKVSSQSCSGANYETSPTTFSTFASFSYTITSLTNDQIYCFKAQSVGYGYDSYTQAQIEYDSGFSSPSSATPHVLVPTPPKTLAAHAGKRYVNLTWSAPNDNGGAAISNYKIYKGTSRGAETFFASVAGNILLYKDTNILSGATYFYKVAAQNSAGDSPQSNEDFATILIPSPPQNFIAQAGRRSIYLTWGAPDDNGEFSIVNYKIFRGPSSGSEIFLVNVSGSTLMYNDTNVLSGYTYFYKIVAQNSKDESPASSEVSATVLTPSPPQNLFAKAGNAAVNLNWTKPNLDGGKTITAYKVKRGSASGKYNYDLALISVPAAGWNVVNYTDNNVQNDLTYFYSIIAANADGEGAISNEVFATPTAPPGAPIPPDTVSPVILSTSIEDGSEDVGTDTAGITISFSEPMNVQTGAGISLLPPKTFSKVWSDDKKNLTITFSGNLSYGTNYEFKIGKDFKDLAGNALITDFIIHFKTESLNLPPTTTTTRTTTTLPTIVTTRPPLTTTVSTPPSILEAEALSAIESTKRFITSAQALNKNVSDARNFYLNAIDAYNSGNYAEAKSLAQEAKTMVKDFSPEQTEIPIAYIISAAIIIFVAVGGIFYYTKIKKANGAGEPEQPSYSEPQ